MKYLSLFTGIGGFELGIEKAYALRHADRAEIRGEQAEAEGVHKAGTGLVTKERKGSGSKDGRAGASPADDTDERPLCVGYSEIDRYAVQIYEGHYPEHKNYGDITEIDERGVPDIDLLCGGFPCQSFSVAGKRGGFEDTRGTLFFDIARIAKHKRPRLLLLENVKGLLSHDGGRTFNTIIAVLDELGYDLQWQVLNSQDFGVPHNRERVYIVGHRRGTPRPQVFPFGKADGETNRKRVVSTTIDSNYWKGIDNHGQRTAIAHLPEVRIRRLTPLECERLQGFPDGWTSKVSDTQRYKTLGNAVTVNVIEAIVAKLI